MTSKKELEDLVDKQTDKIRELAEELAQAKQAVQDLIYEKDRLQERLEASEGLVKGPHTNAHIDQCLNSLLAFTRTGRKQHMDTFQTNARRIHNARRRR